MTDIARLFEALANVTGMTWDGAAIAAEYERLSDADHYAGHASDAPSKHDCTEWGCWCPACDYRADRCEVIAARVAV